MLIDLQYSLTDACVMLGLILVVELEEYSCSDDIKWVCDYAREQIG